MTTSVLTPRQLAKLRTADPYPNRVGAALQLADMTHAELAAAIGIGQPHVTDIVNGNYSKMPLETARKIADVFGCTIEDVFPPPELPKGA